MKRVLICCLLCLLLCGCSGKAASNPADPQGSSASESIPQESSVPESIPQELPGVWVSASAGERNMIETITFGENGSLMVHLDYEGSDYSTVYGTYCIRDGKLVCDITEGATPFQVEYAFRIDGRELYLTDEDGEAHYLRNS